MEILVTVRIFSPYISISAYFGNIIIILFSGSEMTHSGLTETAK